MSEAGAPESPDGDLAGGPAAGYRVLARKYRPSSFEDLIGQEAMVRTVSNAFATNRIPQAWIFTGVRGVGKTTTARILARALNYEVADGSITAPTIALPTLGLHCQAIMESRHLDVMEMDAASHNGVDDVRQINDAVRYSPVSARYKVYILDEVHMLSGAAFNALLKTLEEPPPHVKFVFATTEIRKVPVTVLSRCQRFDLRRVEGAALVRHLQGIAGKEALEADEAALALIARAAEGSVRDALSLFDQAIAHAAGPIRAEHVRQMLGLADRARVVDLFDALMRGDMPAALSELRAQYDIGADPGVLLSDLAEFTHFVTRVKVVPSVAEDVSLAEAERTRGRDFAEKLSMSVLSRTWQMLLKGIAEVQAAPRPIAAAEMVLIRIAYAAGLPSPEDVVRSLDDAGETPAAPGPSLPPPRPPVAAPPRALSVASTQGAPARQMQPDASPREMPIATASAAPGLAVNSFADLVALAASRRDIQAKMALERDVRLVRCEDGRLEVALEPSARPTLLNDLSRKFQDWTGRPWKVTVSREPGEMTLRAQNEARDAELKRGVRADPLVQAVLAKFPGAEIITVREPMRDDVALEMPVAADLPDNDDS